MEKKLLAKYIINKDENEILDEGLSLLGNKIKEKISLIKCSKLTLTNNEIKDIMKVITSLEKGATRKITSHGGGFLNFLKPLVAAGLPLMKNLLTPLAKNVLLPFGLSAGMSAVDAAILKKIYGSGSTAFINSNA